MPVIPDFIAKWIYKILIVLSVFALGFISGIHYESRSQDRAVISEQKEIIVDTKKTNDDLNVIAGKADTKKETVRTVYVPKIVEKVRTEIVEKPVYTDVNCAIPKSGVDILDELARTLNEQAKDTK